jgi:hypothetical protein
MSDTYIDSDSIFKAPFEIFPEETKVILKLQNGEIFTLSADLGIDSLKQCDKTIITNANGIKAYSIIGVAETKKQNYLIAVTRTKFVGKILSSNIFKICEVKI